LLPGMLFVRASGAHGAEMRRIAQVSG
jgi:hypothetical protein